MITVLNDLHLGRKNGNNRLLQDFEAFIDFMLNNKHEHNTLIINGDFFDNSSNISVKVYNSAKKFFKDVSISFDKIYLNLGNHDMCKRKSYDETMFDIFELHDNIEIIREPKKIYGDFDFEIVPYGFWKNFIPTTDLVFTHDDNPSRLEDDDNFTGKVLNGHYHKSGITHDTVMNLGLCYQLDSSDADSITGYHIITDPQNVKFIPYEIKSYLNIYFDNNKIEGLQPVKWLMENKPLIKAAYEIKVIADHETANSSIERFNAILETINSSFVFVDMVSESENTKLSVNKTIIDTITSLVPEDEAYTMKILSLYKEASNLSPK